MTERYPLSWHTEDWPPGLWRIPYLVQLVVMSVVGTVLFGGLMLAGAAVLIIAPIGLTLMAWEFIGSPLWNLLT